MVLKTQDQPGHPPNMFDLYTFSPVKIRIRLENLQADQNFHKAQR